MATVVGAPLLMRTCSVSKTPAPGASLVMMRVQKRSLAFGLLGTVIDWLSVFVFVVPKPLSHEYQRPLCANGIGKSRWLRIVLSGSLQAVLGRVSNPGLATTFAPKSGAADEQVQSPTGAE